MANAVEQTLRVAFVTVGETGRLTGGYLYNARVLAGLRARGVEVEEVVASGASVGEQRAAVGGLGALVEPGDFDAIVADALARVVVAPHLDRWRVACPVVALVHELPSVAGGEARERGYEEPLLGSDALIAVSGHGRRVLEDKGVPAGRIRVVSPGFDRLAALDAAVREDPDLLRVLCVAQWIPRKGLLELVRAWQRRGRPGAFLELVGETDADPAYAKAVRRAVGLDPSILIRGPVDDAALALAYTRADLFALPSFYEGYGIVYAEALRFGLPVIACDVGPVPDLIGPEAALLVPPGDEGALTEALDALLKNPALRKKMSTAARERARRLPSWEDAVSGFHEVLRAVVAEREVVRGR